MVDELNSFPKGQWITFFDVVKGAQKRVLKIWVEEEVNEYENIQ